MKQNNTTQPEQPTTEGEWTKGKLYSEKRTGGMGLWIDTPDRSKSRMIIAAVFSDQQEANAARIVECWNQHDQLKADNEALKEARSQSMKHISNLNGEMTELKEANIELIAGLEIIKKSTSNSTTRILLNKLIKKHTRQ